MRRNGDKHQTKLKKKSWSKREERQHDDKKVRRDDRNHRKKSWHITLITTTRVARMLTLMTARIRTSMRASQRQVAMRTIILPWRSSHLLKKQSLNATLSSLRRRRLCRVSARPLFLAKGTKSHRVQLRR